MLKPKNRLRKMKDFDILFEEGKFVGGEFFTLKIWKIEPEKYPRRKYEDDELRVGFVVGLKVSKKAIKRNRIKRQIREVIRLLLKEDKIKTGYHMAIVAKPTILDKTYSEIELDIDGILSKAGVL
jgi:ribonuclease P protein component